MNSANSPLRVLTRPEDVQTVFKDSDKHTKALNNDSGYILGELLGRCVGLISGSDWKRVRAVCEGSFLQTKARDQIPIAQRQTRRHFKRLLEHSQLSKSIIDPAKDLKMLPFWVIAEVLYGPLTPEEEHTLEEMATQRAKLFQHVTTGGIMRFHWSKYLPTKTNKDLQDFKTCWSRFNATIFERSTDAGYSSPLVEMYKAFRSGKLTLTELDQTLDEMLFANLDVTLGGISWNLIFLAMYPPQQAQLQNEVLEKRKGSRDDYTKFNGYLLSNNTYLAACVKESSRLKPLAAFTVPQAAPTARVVGGYYIPTGTNFIVDSYALNQRNPYWGKDATQFKPERFLERKAHLDRYSFWRFGFGPRQCMGKFVADVIIKVLLVHLVEEYELRLLESDMVGEWATDPDSWINHPVATLRCTKRGAE